MMKTSTLHERSDDTGCQIVYASSEIMLLTSLAYCRLPFNFLKKRINFENSMIHDS